MSGFSLWSNGLAFGVFVVCGIALLLVSRTENAAKKACVLFAINLFYLAIRLPLFAFLPPDSAFYVGHQPEIIAMFSMSTGVLVTLFLIQLSHLDHVTVGYALSHFFVFFQLIVVYYIVALVGVGTDNYLTIIFRLYVLVITGYTLTHVYMIYKAFRRYDRELNNIYVNTDRRRLVWFTQIVVISVVLFVGNVIANFLIHGSLPSEIYLFLCTFVWALFAYRVAMLRESFISYKADMVEDEVSIEVEVADTKAEEVEAFMKRLREVLETDNLLYDEDLTRDDVMRAMSITHVTLGRNLHAATGMTFSAYVTDLRLEHIADRLLNSDDNIERLYYSCGFRSRTTFYRAFARKYNCSPVEYRRNKGR